MAAPEGAGEGPHPLDAAIRLAPVDGADRRLRGATSEAYWNSVGPFGGVTAAVMLQAVLQQPDRIGQPLSLTVNFPAAVLAGPFDIVVRLLRGGRTTQHWALDLVQGEADQPMASALVACGVRRPVWTDREARAPALPPPPSGFGPRPGAFPVWLRLYREHVVRGGLFGPSASSESAAWIVDHPPRPLDYPALAAMCDAFFPRIFMRHAAPLPVATVSLNVYFHGDAAAMAEQGTEPLLGEARGQVFESGFFDQEGRMWGREGRLLATTHQVVWYRD
jgi:acyl-CoA thioesterase